MKEKKEKEKKEREEKKKSMKDKSEQDFLKEGLKGPDIMALLVALQTQVEELAKDSRERKEREKIQSQFQWYPQYQQ